MINKDIDTLRELTSSDKTFVHMSGKEQTREEFFNDIRNNHLQYFSIGIENPIITINDEFASIEFTSILNAVAYGLKGSFQMDTKHYFKNLNGQWININEPSK